MEITAAMVKKLREMTGAGVMNCKKALVETDGDYDKAVEVLRKKGGKIKSTHNNAWTRRPHRRYTIFFKTTKYTNLWNKINCWFNQKQIRRTQFSEFY